MDELIPLSNATLGQLPKDVRVPRYDRSKLTPGIVHIGLGNFHRAHQAWYLHRLMDQGLCHDWAIVGAGVRAYDAAMRDKLLAQDCLTTLIKLDPSGTSAEVSGSMIDYLPIEPDNAALIRQMADPRIRIVSMTVTEGGYYIDPDTREFNAGHPDIVHDVQNPQAPRTAFGAMVAALKLRREAGVGAFAAQSCDNLPGNGRVMRRAVVSLARLIDPDLAAWIDDNASFPNAMVDCIVPATGPREVALAKKFGIDDAAPVTHENFRQWVIEDDFCAGRPDWDLVGATFSDRVHDYEAMKLRILNGGHATIAYAAGLLELKYVHEAMEHPLVRPFLDKVELQEIVPGVPPVPDTDIAEYYELIARRFSNPKINDAIWRICFDGSNKQEKFTLDSARVNLKQGRSISGLVLQNALWCRYCYGTTEMGTELPPNDPAWDRLTETAKRARENPRAWLEQRDVYGDLKDNAAFADAFDAWLRLIWAEGTETALRTYIGS